MDLAAVHVHQDRLRLVPIGVEVEPRIRPVTIVDSDARLLGGQNRTRIVPDGLQLSDTTALLGGEGRTPVVHPRRLHETPAWGCHEQPRLVVVRE